MINIKTWGILRWTEWRKANEWRRPVTKDAVLQTFRQAGLEAAAIEDQDEDDKGIADDLEPAELVLRYRDHLLAVCKTTQELSDRLDELCSLHGRIARNSKDCGAEVVWQAIEQMPFTDLGKSKSSLAELPGLQADFGRFISHLDRGMWMTIRLRLMPSRKEDSKQFATGPNTEGGEGIEVR